MICGMRGTLKKIIIDQPRPSIPLMYTKQAFYILSRTPCRTCRICNSQAQQEKQDSVGSVPFLVLDGVKTLKSHATSKSQAKFYRLHISKITSLNYPPFFFFLRESGEGGTNLG